MFTHADFQTQATVDKRGRKVGGVARHVAQQVERSKKGTALPACHTTQVSNSKKSGGRGEDLRRYYRLRDEVRQCRQPACHQQA
jgi:hypothetical protein